MSGGGAFPAPSFTALVDLLGAQAFVALGGYAPPGQEPTVDLPHAEFMIELLRVLRAKSEGHCTAAESKHLRETLDGLQRSYVAVKQRTPAGP